MSEKLTLSKDLLNQPIPDDPIEMHNAGNAIEAFLLGETQAAQAEEDAAPEAAKLNAVDAEIQAAEDELDDLDESPAQRYTKLLGDAKISVEDAMNVIDTLVVQLVPYREDVTINRKVSATFITRKIADEEKFQQVLEKLADKPPSARMFAGYWHNLSLSLVRYGEKTFNPETPEGQLATVKWLQSLPTPTFNILLQRQWAFDRKIDTIFSDGWSENF